MLEGLEWFIYSGWNTALEAVDSHQHQSTAVSCFSGVKPACLNIWLVPHLPCRLTSYPLIDTQIVRRYSNS
jgi:hypothetical protein